MLTVLYGCSGKATQTERGDLAGTSQRVYREGWSSRWPLMSPLTSGTVSRQRQKVDPGAGAREPGGPGEERGAASLRGKAAF